MRITEKVLQDLVDTLNELRGCPHKPYRRDSDGHFVWNDGVIVLDGQNPGDWGRRYYRLEVIRSSGGRDFYYTSTRLTGRELYLWLDGHIAGLEKMLHNEHF